MFHLLFIRFSVISFHLFRNSQILPRWDSSTSEYVVSQELYEFSQQCFETLQARFRVAGSGAAGGDSAALNPVLVEYQRLDQRAKQKRLQRRQKSRTEAITNPSLYEEKRMYAGKRKRVQKDKQRERKQHRYLLDRIAGRKSADNIKSKKKSKTA